MKGKPKWNPLQPILKPKQTRFSGERTVGLRIS
jgi:hypothetical protein